MLLWTFLCTFLFENLSSNLDYASTSGIAGSSGNAGFNLLWNWQTIFIAAWTFYISPSNAQRFQFLYILTNIYYIDAAILVGVKCISLWFDLHCTNNQLCWAYFHLPVAHLFTYFGERSPLLIFQLGSLLFVFELLEFYTNPRY